MMELKQTRLADERAEEEAEGEQSAAKPASHLINSGEAALLLGFTGFIELVQWGLDAAPAILTSIPVIGWVLGPGMSAAAFFANILIALFVGGSLLLWVNGKVAKGAPRKWYKIIYIGATGSVIPIIPGYLGAIIYLLILDRKILGKIATRALGEKTIRLTEKRLMADIKLR